MLTQLGVKLKVALLYIFASNKKQDEDDTRSPSPAQQQQQKCKPRTIISILIIVFLCTLVYHSIVAPHRSSSSSSTHNIIQPKPSSQEAKRNLESDLNEVALEVQNGGVPFETLYHHEDFFVVWNRVFMLAADVAMTVVDGEYRNLPEGEAEEEFYHHFRFLFRSGNPKHYKPKFSSYQFVPIVNRFLVDDLKHQQEDGTKDFFDPARPFVVFIRTNQMANFYHHLESIVRDAKSGESKNINFLRKFILVTGWTDPGPSSYAFAQDLLQSEYIVKWWAQNCDLVDTTNNKMECLPIGIDWHTVARGPRWKLPQLTPYKQVERMRELANDEMSFYLNFKQVAKIQNHGIPTHMFTDRRNKILMDFALGSNTMPRLKMWLHLAFGSPFCMSPWTATGNWISASRDDIWRNYLSYRFVLSPPGNGYECHRTYEALILGAIPIMKLHPNPAMRPVIEKLYKDLPVIFVEDYTCEYINDESMEKWNKFGEEFWKNQEKVNKMRKKLLNRYWVEKIRGIDVDV